ncbi:MAG: DUF4157 domain-containing protein [Bacteroidetes bacterium]|nr:DUF4157 domain-containing protein [Bacteroidota bacterium]
MQGQVIKKAESRQEKAIPGAAKTHEAQRMKHDADLQLQNLIGNHGILQQNGVPLIQAKLKISQPGDKYEQEADCLAEKVIHMTSPNNLSFQYINKVSADTVHINEHPLIESVLRSPGQPLDRLTREYMEPRFGLSFNHVRIHNDELATKSASALNAVAYTAGNHIVFGTNNSVNSQTQPRIVAHELAHVVQQGVAGNSENKIYRFWDVMKARAMGIARQLQQLIFQGTWSEIRKRVYPMMSAGGVQRAKERYKGTRTDLTGLGKLTRLENFAENIRKIMVKWTSMTPINRLRKLGTEGSNQLEAVKVPGFLIVDKEEMTPMGYFSPSLWKLALNENFLANDSPTIQETGEMANTVLHESRHAEQNFLSARYSAGVNKIGAKELSVEHGIPIEIAYRAVVSKFDSKTDKEVFTLGRNMYQAMITEGPSNKATSANMGSVIKVLIEKKIKADMALRDLLESTATEGTIRKATVCGDELKAQITVVEEAYKLYRQIPYEVDAHDVGDAADLAVRKWEE